MIVNLDLWNRVLWAAAEREEIIVCRTSSGNAAGLPEIAMKGFGAAKINNGCNYSHN